MKMREQAQLWAETLRADELHPALDAITQHLQELTLDGVKERAVPSRLVWRRMALHDRRLAIWRRLYGEGKMEARSLEVEARS